MPSDVDIGAWLDNRYQVVGKLGAGGFADVYEATDPESGASVAIKVLKPGAAGYDATTLKRFEREAEALQRLPGDGFARLLHQGQADGAPYLVFELVRGEDLSQLLARRGKLGPDETIAILRQLASVLAAAHEAGVLHRDLKPENVRVTDERGPRVKLLDFGIARLTDEGSPSLTATGELIGTPHYMSPEQLTGRPLGPASDIYSLGVVAFELLLGRGAMHGRSLGSQIDRLLEDFAFPEAEIGGYGDGLLRILRRMTDVDPAQRHQSARAVLVALDALERDPTVFASRQVALPPPQAAADEDHVPGKWPYGVLAAGIVAVVAIAALKWISADEPIDQPVARKQTPAGTRFAPWKHEAAPRSVAEVDTDAGPPAPPPRTDAGTALGPCAREPWFHGPGKLLDDVPAYLPRVPIGERMPLVIMLDGNNMNSRQWLDASGFTELARDHHFALVAPEGQIRAWEGTDRVRDLKRLEFVQNFAQQELCIDPQRIFIVGQEQAGGITYDLACKPWVAGIALNAYSLSEGVDCDGVSIPKPMMLSLPESYGWTPPGGGPNCRGTERLSFDEQEELWRKRNGCTEEVETSKHAGAVCSDWTCGQPLRVCRTKGGGDWPGSEPVRWSAAKCESAPTSFQHARQMWDFFQKLPAD